MYLLDRFDLGLVETPAMNPGKAANSLVSLVGGRAGSNSCAAKGLDPTQLGVAPWAAARNTSFRCWSKRFLAPASAAAPNPDVIA